jgi:hypothetical protein
MIRVKVGKLKEGQVLAQDVTRGDGVVLMAKGREITPEVISLLDRLDVESVVVEGDSFTSEEERLAWLQRQEQALYTRFSRVENDPLLMGVRELFRRRLVKGCSARVSGTPAPAPATAAGTDPGSGA